MPNTTLKPRKNWLVAISTKNCVSTVRCLHAIRLSYDWQCSYQPRNCITKEGPITARQGVGSMVALPPSRPLSRSHVLVRRSRVGHRYTQFSRVGLIPSFSVAVFLCVCSFKKTKTEKPEYHRAGAGPIILPACASARR